MRSRFALALLAIAMPALAQAPAETPPAPPVPAVAHVAIETAAGIITLEIEKQRAPITAANFLRYVDQKRLDGATFYRATNVAPGFGLVQFGVRNDPKRVLPSIAHEPTSKTGLSHTDGTISIARAAPGTANGDFFITIGALTSMDADPSLTGDNQGFAAFGHVSAGMDVVHRILAAPVSATAGAGVMKGQMLAAPIRILHARRVD